MARSDRRPAPRTPDTFWGRRSPTARHAIALGFLLIVSLAFFSPIHFGGKSLYGGDIVNWRGMAEAMIQYQNATGNDALWAPNAFAGMPGYLIKYGPEVPQVDTLITWTRSFAWPTSHLFLLLAGTYLLAFFLTRDTWAGLLASVGFGFTTYLPILLVAGHQTKFVALAFAPWLLLAFVYTLRRPSLLGGLLFAAALAAELRAKHPQITYYVLMAALVWWLVAVVRAVRKGDTRPIAKATGWLAMGTGLGLLMVIQPYWVTYEYKQYSVRGAASALADGAAAAGGGSMGWENAMRWSQGVGELITLIIANAFGGAAQYWGPKPFTAGPHYVGGAVFALAMLALWKVKRRVVWGLGAAALATTLFALGRHAAWLNRPMFEFFPFFDAFRAPETWLSITALLLAVLGGFGLNYLLRDRAADRARPLLVVFGSVLGVVLLLTVAKDTFFDFERPGERQRYERAIQQQRPDLPIQSPRVQRFIDQQLAKQKDARRAAFQSDATRTMIVLVVVALLLWLARRKTLQPWVAGALVVLVVLIDLWGVDKRFLGPDAYSTAPTAEQAIATYDVDRFLKQKMREAGGSGHFRVLPLALNPMNNAQPSYHYESLGGYHGAKLRVYQDYIDHILNLDAAGPPNETALDLLNTRYIIARQQLPGTTVAYRGPQTGLRVLKNPDAVPRAFFVGQTDVVRSAEQLFARLRSPSFTPRHTALLSEPLAADIAPIDSSSTTQVTLQKHTPPELQWTVQTNKQRLLVVSEIYYPAGWRAYIDGEPVPIHRVDYLLRGVVVPPGQHTVTMRFAPVADTYGTWIAAAATVADYGGIAVLLGLRYRRRNAADAEETDDDGDSEPT
ncbi:YfhO family protein [Salisaeta longa]|uniref:YfhO family protein n=1 Tax=Salisaeta longa TaxID=503170 RepID=UPI0004289B68|nr:YfhO family protein [Salisaeta longa]